MIVARKFPQTAQVGRSAKPLIPYAYLKRVRDAAGGTTYWEAVSTNAWGRLQNESFGNGIASYTEYDPANGWLNKRQAGVGGGTGRNVTACEPHTTPRSR